MAILEILKDGSPVLKKVAKRISQIDAELLQLIEDMKETMTEAHGLGLAANQVGIPRRIIIAFYEDGPRAYINPRIVRWSREWETTDEGCLSFPLIYGKVKRDLKVLVEAQDLELKKHRFKAEGLGARVFQHEIDHLNGITFDTRAEPGTLREIRPDEIEGMADEQENNIQGHEDEPITESRASGNAE